jgi:AbrB family looped-hinge helix DNA binding protein
MRKQAKVTSKEQVTVLREIRRRLGVRAGDRLLFEEDGDGVRVTAVRKESPFKKYEAPGIQESEKEEKEYRSVCGRCAANR